MATIEQIREETESGTGIFPMPAADYFADHSAWSQSMLKVFMDRRRLAEAYYVTGTAEPPEPTDPMRKGTATHTALLEPERFDRLVVTYPRELLAKNGAVSTNAAKDFRDEQEAAGRVVLKADQFSAVRSMAESVRKVCGRWLELPGKKEQSIYWADDITGLRLKARIDWIVEREERQFIFDLKTTNDVSPAAFRKRIEDGYWIQAEHYAAGVEAVTGRKTTFIFVAVESAFPFSTALYELDAEAIGRSIDGRRAVLNQLADCLARNDFRESWEGRVVPLSVREWAFNPQL